jgi:hypothetical protein
MPSGNHYSRKGQGGNHFPQAMQFFYYQAPAQLEAMTLIIPPAGKNSKERRVREMSLQARLDIAGALHYIILRGVEKFKSSWTTKIGRPWSRARLKLKPDS